MKKLLLIIAVSSIIGCKKETPITPESNVNIVWSGDFTNLNKDCYVNDISVASLIKGNSISFYAKSGDVIKTGISISDTGKSNIRKNCFFTLISEKDTLNNIYSGEVSVYRYYHIK